jgi:hypothetical protein
VPGLILTRILVDGSILTALVSVAAVLLLYIRPRLALSDYPEDVKATVPPRTQQEFRQGVALSIPLLIVAVAIPLYSAWLVRAQLGHRPQSGCPAAHRVAAPDRLPAAELRLAAQPTARNNAQYRREGRPAELA